MKSVEGKIIRVKHIERNNAWINPYWLYIIEADDKHYSLTDYSGSQVYDLGDIVLAGDYVNGAFRSSVIVRISTQKEE